MKQVRKDDLRRTRRLRKIPTISLQSDNFDNNFDNLDSLTDASSVRLLTETRKGEFNNLNFI